jgi:hypothetical protein
MLRPAGADKLSNVIIRQKLRDMFTFVGVATTPLDYTNTNNKDNLALQIGGSVTIYNTGGSTIRPGQRIIWDVPALDGTNNVRKRNIRGEPQSKRLFVVQPLEDALAEARLTTSADGSNDFVNTLHKCNPHTTALAPGAPADAGATGDDTYHLSNLWTQMKNAGTALEAEYATKAYNRAILHMFNAVHSRVIGIALSGAAPGDQFDIMLCSAH